MTQYWVVGATVSGEDMTEKFIKHGFWFGDKDTAQDKIDKIAVHGPFDGTEPISKQIFSL